MNARQIQEALAAAGFNPGEIDGIWGRRTMRAVREFQSARGLDPDGIVGPRTLAALSGAAPGQVPHASSGLISWYEVAKSLIGLREVVGAGDEEGVLNLADNLDLDYKSDDIPWCGLFVAHCIAAALPEEALPRNPLRARAWEKFGERCEPMRGAVLVFHRDGEKSGKGHVGFYRSEDATHYHVLGGNQNNAVNIAKIPKNRHLATRWPSTASVLAGAKLETELNAPMNVTEA